LIDADASHHAVAELAELVALEPRHERLWQLRILALHRSGRPSEALRAYDDMHAVLSTTLPFSILCRGPGQPSAK
jgi:DNA-binding SARP family transcriptional activator